MKEYLGSQKHWEDSVNQDYDEREKKIKEQTDNRVREHIDSVLPNKTIKCPVCGVGENSIDDGGNDKCFHCGTCGFVECECFNPYTKDPIKDILDMIESRLIKFQNNRNDK